MKPLVDARLAIDAAVLAAKNYADLVTDRDPDDGEHVVPGELRRFMARLRLLHGVPFSYLVPDSDLLPPESMRFFYIDRAWTDALVQGALSVGTISSADRTQLEAVYPHIRAEVDEAERTVRMPRREARLTAGGGTITGFLMRSRAVSGWPNLHVRAYTRDVLPDDALSTVAESDPNRIKVLRMERLAPAVLLVLFDGVPVVVHVEEPRQGIQFGVVYDDDANPGSARVPVRDCATGLLKPPKNQILPSNSVAVPFRPNAPGVIDMRVLRDRLAAAAPNSGGTLEPGEYALQMLRFPYRQVFGDPSNQDGVRFYALDAFQPKVFLTDWKKTVATRLGG
jgi:hypothetical protein